MTGPTKDLALQRDILQMMDATPITDIHTHLYAPAFGDLLLWGVDELLNHHYLIAEALRWGGKSPEDFYSLGRREQADYIWQTLFIDHSPVSASALGFLETMQAFGLDISSRNLDAWRAHFQSLNLEEHIDNLFEIVGLESVVMTNDPLDPAELPTWESGFKADSRFHAALRLDSLILNWEASCLKLKEWGYDVELNLTGKTFKEVRRFLSEWIERMGALYAAISLPPDFRFPDESVTVEFLEECVLPVAREKAIPVGLMIGVRRQVNPALQLAGDSVGLANVASVEAICARYPDNRFLVTLLARENQYELCVAARKFPNLMIFGCWWFLNIPYIIDEMTRMRVELLGTSVIPHHSDVRILEQVVPKWLHAKHITAEILAEKYTALRLMGWNPKDAEIQRDISDLFGGNFWRFLGR